MGCLYTREERGIIMKKYLVLPALMAALFTPFMYADVEGSVGVDSDYFWRGVSQNDGNPAISLNLEYQGDGFYAGVWGSQVDYGDDIEIEYDWYAGYALALTDAMAIDVGLIQYNYDTNLDILVDGRGHDKTTYKSSEELYLGVGLNNFQLYHFVNIDNSDLTFTELEYQLPFISQVDVSLMYAMHSDESAALMGADEDYFGMKMSKNYGNVKLSAMVMDGARHGDVMDMASVGIHYNF